MVDISLVKNIGTYLINASFLRNNVFHAEFLAIYSYTNQQSISSECQILNILGLASQEIVSSAVQTTLLMDILIVIFIVCI